MTIGRTTYDTETLHAQDAVQVHKASAKRLRSALAEDGIAITHAKALELVAKQNGVRDWNTLVAQPALAAEHDGTTPFAVGDRVAGTFNGREARGRVIGLEETIKPDLWRVTVAFNPPVNAATSQLFTAERRRVQMVVGADGRSRRLTGTETGVMELKRA
ncbi:glyoxalase superfamily protein [Mesorhizobium sp. Root552]|uniref:glyoxalase superfamily protein n=1 Tax=Mesorhizobium sp. Root552 TaxID=1736555 RepID=UPI000A9E1C93|nr:glyoxalase superfamily protein [Mesorhizobium sp. Root552]